MYIKEKFHANLSVIREQKEQLGEAKDEREYGYEGDMAITQLKTICRNAENLLKMMKPDTDLPEWVQSKITKSEDYISTAHDYLASEMNEETEHLGEATLGGEKYKSKRNPNNRKSTKSKEKINAAVSSSYGGVADATGNKRKRLLQKGKAAFDVGLAQKYAAKKK